MTERVSQHPLVSGSCTTRDSTVTRPPVAERRMNQARSAESARGLAP
jgi:hypothetical protein